MAEWVLAGSAIFSQLVIGIVFVLKIGGMVEQVRAIMRERHEAYLADRSEIQRRLSILEGRRA